MWFLIAQILPLMLISAIIGWALGYWWMNSRFEDVTESHAQLLDAEQARARRPVVTPEDLDALRDSLAQQLARIQARVEAIGVPAPTDLAPVQQRLDDVHAALREELRQIEPVAIDFTRADLEAGHREARSAFEGLHARLEAVEGRFDLEPVHAQLRDLEERVRSLPGVDLGPVHARLDQLEAQLRDTVAPAADLEPVHAHLRHLEERVASTPTVDLGPALAQLDAIRAALGSQSVDLEPVTSRLDVLHTALETREPAHVDLEPLTARFASLEAAFGTRESAPVDLEPLAVRLDGLKAAIDSRAVPGVDLDPLVVRLGAVEMAIAAASSPEISEHLTRIEEHLGVLSSPTVELAPLYERLAEIEAQIATVGEPVDLAPLHERLSELEQRLAAPPTVDLDGVHARLIGLEGAIQALRPPRVDLQPLESRMDVLSTDLQEARTSLTTLTAREAPDLSAVFEQFDSFEGRFDLVSIENRLTAIEYGLAAVHHQLRTRGEAVVTRTGGVRVERRAAGSRQGPRFDPIDPMRRASDSNFLTEAAFGVPDDLTLLDGVGDPLRDLLHDLGVFYFWQLAEWTPEDVARIQPKLLDFRGRIEEHDLVGQARRLAARATSAARPGIGEADS